MSRGAEGLRGRGTGRTQDLVDLAQPPCTPGDRVVAAGGGNPSLFPAKSKVLLSSQDAALTENCYKLE